MRISDWSSDVCSSDLHFSADAAEDISADPVLGPVFARHAHWLVSTPGNESIDAARDWNRRFPDAQVEMIPDRGEWSILPTWSMPKFHILRGGKVIETVTGWPRSPNAHRQPLIDARRPAGLLVQATAHTTPQLKRRETLLQMGRSASGEGWLKYGI